MFISCEASGSRHPLLDIWILVHGCDGHLPVLHRPLQHGIIWSAAEVKGHGNVVTVSNFSSIRVNADPKTVTFRVVGAIAANFFTGGRSGEQAREVLDLPDAVGTNGLCECDVIDQDGTRGVSRSSDG